MIEHVDKVWNSLGKVLEQF